MKITPLGASWQRGVVSIHRRYFPDGGLRALAEMVEWTLPEPIVERGDPLVGSGAIGHVHLGVDRTDIGLIRKVYLEFDPDHTCNPDVFGLPSNLCHLAFKWTTADRSLARTTHYLHMATIDSERALEVLGEPSDAAAWTAEVRAALLERFEMTTGPSIDALEVHELDSARRSYDFRVPRSHESLRRGRWLRSLLDANGGGRVGEWCSADGGDAVVERMAVGRSDEGVPFVTVYFSSGRGQG